MRWTLCWKARAGAKRLAMIEIENSGFPFGTVGLPSGLQPRFWEFQDSLDALKVPQGTTLCRRSSCDLVYNLNRIVLSMTGDWALFLDDDNSFEPDLLLRLLSHTYGPFSTLVDVIMPINIGKIPPFDPTIFHGPWQSPVAYSWNELSGPGLWPLPKGDLVGRSGMLIKKRVLDTLKFPWFRCGQLAGGAMQEDFHFCLELQSRGHTVWIDREIVLPHHFLSSVTARRGKDGRYRPEMGAASPWWQI